MKSTVTSKGQVTIPLAIREKANIVPGSQLDFQIDSSGIVTVRVVTGDVTDLKGMVKTKRRRPVSLEEMKQAIVAGAKRNFQ